MKLESNIVTSHTLFTLSACRISTTYWIAFKFAMLADESLYLMPMTFLQLSTSSLYGS